jgi:flavodoxin
MLDFVAVICKQSWLVIGQMAPYLLFGFLAARVLSVLISPRWVECHIGGPGTGSVLKASLFGVPLPLCSCSVIPVSVSIRRHGASRAATAAFLLSTPQAGVDSIAVTYALLGPVFAIFRPLTALFTGLIGGSLVRFSGESEGSKAMNHSKPNTYVEACRAGKERTSVLLRIFKYGLVTLPRDIGLALLVGVLTAGAMAAIVPQDYLIETPMVHWPESMFTYIPEERLLFSMDAFGQHYASSQRFGDEVPLEMIMGEAKSYYANIIMPYSKQVTKMLKEIDVLDIEMIVPSHGLIWRGHIQEMLKACGAWAAFRPKLKVLIIYDTMWGSTGEMAQAILEGAALPGVEVQLTHIRSSNLTRITTELLDTATIAFGSSTLNAGMMPMAAAVLTYLKGLRPTGKAGLAFGSYGWGRGGPEAIDEYMKDMKWEILHNPLKAQDRPTAEILDECRKAGKLLAVRAKDLAE